MKEIILDLIIKYREDFNKLDAEPIFTDEKIETKQQLTDHAFGVLNQIEELLEKNQIEKANRWLGFVQSVLFFNGIYSFNEINRHHWPTNELK